MLAKVYVHFMTMPPTDWCEPKPDSPMSDVPPTDSYELLKLLIKLKQHLTNEDRLYISQLAVPLCLTQYVCVASELLEATLRQQQRHLSKQGEKLYPHRYTMQICVIPAPLLYASCKLIYHNHPLSDVCSLNQ